MALTRPITALILAAVVGALPANGPVVADPLTTPITRTATQFRVDSINLDVVRSLVTIQVSLVDATGKTVRVITLPDEQFTAVGISAGQVAALRQQVIAFLKTKGAIN